MIDSMHGIVKKICSITDFIAGICFFAVMVLILINIIMRRIFGMPITGTAEMVGLMTATGLGFALANCELNDGNIAMSILTDRLSKKTQQIINTLIYLVSLGFWTMVIWRMFVYGSSAFSRGLVSSTVSIPIYPFIFLLGLNVFFLWMVLAFRLICSIKETVIIFRKTVSKERKVGK